MNTSSTHHWFVAGLLALCCVHFQAESVSARLSKVKINRCLTGRFPVQLTEIIQVSDPGGIPLRTVPVSFRGPLRIGFGSANFKGLRFNAGRTMVLGQNKVLVRGGVQGLELLNNTPGSFRIIITKRGGRAKITSGRYTRQGVDNMGNTNRVTNGRINGSMRLPKKCR